MTNLGKQLGTSLTSPVENTQRKEVTLPGQPSRDFIVTARCRIVNVGGRVSMSASDLPGESGGTYTWSTESKKIRLVNATGPAVAIVADVTPSDKRDGEVVQVIRTAADGTKKVKEIALTVARLGFAASPDQLYGFDDNNTPDDPKDNHLSVGSDSHTFVSVTIEGGADSTDFEFIVNDSRICEIVKPEQATQFNLRVNATAVLKGETILRAEVRCLSRDIFAQVVVHVYQVMRANAVIAQFADSKRPATALKWPGNDYVGHAELANNYLYAAAVEVGLEMLDANNPVTDISFEGCDDGTVIFDLGERGGPMMKRFRDALKEYKDYVKVVIVNKVDFVLHLAVPALAGTSTIKVKGSQLTDGPMRIGKGVKAEDVEVRSFKGPVGTLARPLRFNHAEDTVISCPVLGIAGDIVVLQEGNATAQELKWAVIHEVVHSAFGLRDVLDPSNLMHHKNEFTDYRLRYCPRDYARQSGSQNQWEEIER